MPVITDAHTGSGCVGRVGGQVHRGAAIEQPSEIRQTASRDRWRNHVE
jgi:hypothetical protein